MWNKDSRSIYFIGVWHGETQIYNIDLVGNDKLTQLTDGMHDYASLALCGNKIIAKRHSMSMGDEIYAVNSARNGDAFAEAVQLTTENKQIYDQLEMGKVEARWMKTTDGKQMLTWVIYPPQFDPNKKYPTLLFCEGGPQSPVSQFWSYRWNFQIMAANDYIIVAPNRRGLPGFGVEWNEAISGDYGGQCMKDYFTAIDEMAQEPFVDKDRLGCVGARLSEVFPYIGLPDTMTNASRHSSHTTVSSTWKCNIWKRKRNGLPTGIWAALIGKRTTLRHNALLPTPRISSSTNGTPLSSASTERRTSASLPTRQWPPSMQP